MKTRIAFISKKMDMGGIEKAALEILQRLDPNRFEVDYYYRRRPHEAVGELIVDIPSWINVKEIELVDKSNYKEYYPNRVSRLRFWFYYIISYWCKKADESLQYKFQAKINGVSSKEYDLAIAFDGPKAYGVFHTIENIHAQKKVLWIHGDISKEKAENICVKKYYSKYDRIVTVSKEAREILIKKFPKLSLKSEVVYNYVNYSQIKERASQKMDSPFDKFDGIKIVTVGRLGNDKGMIMAAECCKLLLNEGFNIRWLLCGEGPEKKKIEKFIQDNKIEEQFVLLGNQENPYAYIAQCDIYVQPSIREGFCTTTNEAKVLCKPIVTTDVCGMREQFVDGENARIVKVDKVGLYKGIKELILDEDKRRGFSDKLQQINWENQNNYNDLMEGYVR